MDKSTVEKVAHLARIAISDNNIEQYQQDLSKIIDLIDTLDTTLASADLTDIEPLNHPLELIQTLREDIVTEENAREILMQNAPEQQDDMFLVPTVID